MSSSALDWLPDRHLGVAATLAHSDELIGQICDLLFPYQTQESGIVGLREERNGSVSKTVVSSLASMPRKIPLLVADALVTLRAAMEHVIFTEVEYIDGPLEEKSAKLVEMPAAETYEAFEAWKTKRRRNGPPSLRTGGEIVGRIAALQPFHRQQNPRMHPLARLVSHTNHAKHRTPAVVAVGLATMYEDANVPQSIGELKPGPKGPLRIGDVLTETVLGIQTSITMFPTVGINLPSTGQCPVLLNELDEIATWVRTQALPRPPSGGAQPAQMLPTRYDISNTNTDEKLAMSAGAMTSAAAHHVDRLTAAAARLDLVELIGSTDGCPNSEMITDWLDGLSDSAVNERVKRLGANAAAAVSNPQQTIAALMQLRDEAVEFAQHRPSIEAAAQATGAPTASSTGSQVTRPGTSI